MADVSRISGLSPVQYLNGSPWNGQARMYYIPSTDTVAYAIGDPVDIGGSADSNGVASVVKATAGNNSGANMVLGAIVSAGGTKYGSALADPGNLDTIIVPATKTKSYYVMVADDPNIIFQVQEGGTATALAAAQVGLNIDLASGANNGYLSGWVLDNAVTSTGNGLQMKLLGLRQSSDNAFGAYAKWLCQINLHRLKSGVAGV